MNVCQETIIYLTKGEYSDYHVMVHFIAAKDFNTDDVMKSFLDQDSPEDDIYDTGKHDRYIAFLLREKYVAEIDVVNCHVGDYSELIGEWTTG